MWILLRLLSVAVFAVARYYWREVAPIEPEAEAAGPCALHRVRSKRGTVRGTLFGVRFGVPTFFRLTEESGLDRLFKAVGYSREFQTGDAAFDRKVYIQSDDPAVWSVLHQNASARDAVLRLLAAGVTSLHADGSYVWARRSGDTPPDASEAADLATIADALAEKAAAEPSGTVRDPVFWRALLVEAIAWGVAFYGVPPLIEVWGHAHPLYLDRWPVIQAGLLLSVLVLAGLMTFAWLMLRGTSRAHRVFVESAIVLLIGVPFSSVEFVSDVNMTFDRSTAAVVTPVVTRKYTRVSAGRSHSTTYHLALQYEPAAAGFPTDMSVSKDVYTALAPGSRLAITLRQGSLGFPWIESVQAEKRLAPTAARNETGGGSSWR